jgi:signal peptidase I
MDLNEMANFREHIQLSPLSQIREAYVRGEVFNVGDVVRLKGGEVVQIVKRGPNFLVTEDNRKHWLKDVEPIMEETKIKAWVANPLNIKEGWAHDEHKRVKGKYVLYIDRHNQKDELTKRSHIQSGLDAISQQPQDAFKVFRNMNGDTVFQEIKYLPHFYLV